MNQRSLKKDSKRHWESKRDLTECQLFQTWKVAEKESMKDSKRHWESKRDLRNSTLRGSTKKRFGKTREFWTWRFCARSDFLLGGFVFSKEQLEGVAHEATFYLENLCSRKNNLKGLRTKRLSTWSGVREHLQTKKHTVSVQNEKCKQTEVFWWKTW